MITGKTEGNSYKIILFKWNGKKSYKIILLKIQVKGKIWKKAKGN